jgi:multidrug efflux pump subunit AcrB
MPEGSSLERTDKVIRQMSDIALHTDGVADAVAFPGLNALQFTNTPNTGTVFFALKPPKSTPSCRRFRKASPSRLCHRPSSASARVPVIRCIFRIARD